MKPTETVHCDACRAEFETRDALERHVHDVGLVD
jgi:hypothetical protein